MSRMFGRAGAANAVPRGRRPEAAVPPARLRKDLRFIDSKLHCLLRTPLCAAFRKTGLVQAGTGWYRLVQAGTGWWGRRFRLPFLTDHYGSGGRTKAMEPSPSGKFSATVSSARILQMALRFAS